MKLMVLAPCLTSVEAPVWAVLIAAVTVGFILRLMWLAKKENFVYMRDRHSGAILYETAPFSSRLEHVFVFRTLIGNLIAETPLWKTYQLWMTNRTGKKYDQPATPDQLEWFTHAYGVNPEDIEKPLSEYRTMNDYFTRYPRKGTRKIEGPDDNALAVVPCDCRLAVYDCVDDAKQFYIKGTRFSTKELLQDAALSEQLGNCDVAICRLAPHDIHHFYSPVEGRIERIYSAGHWLLDQRRYGHQSSVNVQTESKRMIVVIDTEDFGHLAYVAIGSSIVGSIVISVNEGQHLHKGDEIGFFRYGGSTVTLLFGEGRIKFDADLLELSSQNPVCEVKVRLGNSLGRAEIGGS